MVTGVSTVEECCLGSGLSFRNGSGVCRQCIGEQLLYICSTIQVNLVEAVKGHSYYMQ